MRPINAALRTCSLFVVSLTCACTTIPTRARHDMLGLSRADLVACAGVPDMDEVRDGQEVLTYRQDQQVQGPLDLKGPLSLELSIGGHGTCRASVAVREGHVVRVTYSGPSATLEGRDGACAGVVRGCVKE
ncbi:hypothetical protein GVI59_18655 [Acetobacter sicerae]|nr:hypothetical protein [Acetobacter sicerae]